ncbi:biotin transporter BioY [Primorskyibacter sp. 2E107]|uniref:biotin transporter BioY n=1 Tax=Primorskyibacter sp. 2E107 TaxID=3403458 RepID=UPI003AF84C22
MLTTNKRAVLAEEMLTHASANVTPHRLALVLAGVLVLTLSAKVVVPMWPVPMTMGTFAVLTLGAVYGPGLGLATIGVYILCGALGLDVFAGSSATTSGLAYMAGPTGGYLAGYVLAVLTLGVAARAGWDRSPLRMGLALLAGNLVIYLPGVLWLGVLLGWDKPLLEWGLLPFLLGDVLKLGLAAFAVPLAWRVCGVLSSR